MIKVLTLVSLFSVANAHSWVYCSDYKILTESDKSEYNVNNCDGYTRCGDNSFVDVQKNGFGADSNFQFSRLPNTCQCSIDSEDPQNYTMRSFAPHYFDNELICLAYPSKGHVADECGLSNKFIPDIGTTITRSSKQSVDEFDIFYKQLNGMHAQGVVDYKGYQNCPKFCEKPDRALCTMCFKLENNINPGLYSFKWTWELNPNEYYTTCWDAYVNIVDPNPIHNRTNSANASLISPDLSSPVSPSPVSPSPVSPSPVSPSPSYYGSSSSDGIILPIEPETTKPCKSDMGSSDGEILPIEQPTMPVPTTMPVPCNDNSGSSDGEVLPVTDVPVTDVPVTDVPVTNVPVTDVPTKPCNSDKGSGSGEILPIEITPSPTPTPDKTITIIIGSPTEAPTETPTETPTEAPSADCDPPLPTDNLVIINNKDVMVIMCNGQ